MKFITVRVTKDFDHQLRLAAAQMDMSRSRLVRLALKEKLARLDRTELGDAGPDWAECVLEGEPNIEHATQERHEIVA